MFLIYFLIIATALYGVTLTVLNAVGMGLMGRFIMDAIIIMSPLILFVQVKEIKKRGIYLLIVAYILVGLLLIAINITVNDGLNFNSIVIYASFFRRTVLPFVLVFVFLEILNDEIKIKRLNRFLFVILIIVTHIQVIDFILFQVSPSYNNFMRDFQSLNLNYFGSVNAPNALMMTFFNITIYRPQGFEIDMYASGLFCILIYGYLRLNHYRFSKWQRIIAMFACIASMSKLFMGLLFIIEFTMLFRKNKAKIKEIFNKRLYFKRNILVKKAINYAPVILLSTIFLLYAGYLLKLDIILFIQQNIFDIGGYLRSLDNTMNFLFGNIFLYDLIGRGGVHLIGEKVNLFKDGELYQLDDIEVLLLFFEGGIINFIFLLFLLLGVIFFYERNNKRYFFQFPELYKTFLSCKMMIIIGLLSLLHTLVVFSRQVVVIYMLIYSISLATVYISKKKSIDSQINNKYPKH